ncbi:FAD-dependent oxidoreductase [Anaerolentibacter hominis]|uniref:FAD-dependent oxidoreductase n=1 Tax=Anaerolentibacter hominis TaxID=3079009 RepID=UPI0031B84966
MKVIIIGGVAGGASAAARLRRLNEECEIIVLEKGDYISYANCGLPYYIGGVITNKDALTLQTPESFFSRFRIDVRVRSEAVKIDKEQKKVVVRKQDGETYEESYDKLILSPGASPIRPGFARIEDSRIFTLRNIPDTYAIREFVDTQKPSNVLIAGGGYIGVEMAENLKKCGLEVTIAEMADHLIASLDYDVACDVHHYLRSNGIKLKLNTPVERLQPETDGIHARIGEEEIIYDMVLLSLGVVPDTELAKDCDLERNKRGAILVDESMRTSDPDIYAVGDAIAIRNYLTGQEGYIPLAGPANKQGRIAADHICGLNSTYNGTQGSSVLRLFDMTVASTGLNETAAKSAGIDYEKIYTFSAAHAGYYPGTTNMAVKMLYRASDGLVLGAQIVGFEGVDKRCDVIATAIRGKMTVFDLTGLELCYAPPFSSAKDPVNMIGFIGENIMTGKVKQFYWNDIPSIEEGAVKLDVRTAAEYGRGHIPGTINIPLDSLRDHLDELNKDKTIYVNCQSGLRSYIACRILKQHGFDCYNLAGGFRLYETVTKEVEFDPSPRYDCGLTIEK